jgi:PadR family transcriptional regulator
LLGRLRRERLVTTFWRESEAGPPRRYYQLTPAGADALDDFTAEWIRFRDGVDKLLTKGKSDDDHEH